MVSVARARAIALELPEVTEKPSHGIPTFRAGGKLFAVLREELPAMVIKLDFEERDGLIETDPKVFFLTDHYRNYPMVLVRLREVPVATLRALLHDAWLRVAPKRLVSQQSRDRGKRGSA